MKLWSADILNLLASETQYLFAHLYTFTASDGALDYFTDLDMDIAYGGSVYKSGSLRIEGLRSTISVGMEVDEQNVRILALPTDTLWGALFLSGVSNGLLDGAYVRRDRIFWPLVTGSAWRDITTPASGWPQIGALNNMRVSTITKIGRSHIELKLKSPLELLQQSIPRNYYQPACSWKLYQQADSDGFGCDMVKANFAQNFTVAAGPTVMIIPTSGITVGYTNGVPAPNAPGFSGDGAHTYIGGTIIFTSGAFVNEEVLVKDNDGANFFLARPLTQPPAVGDTFTAYPGCLRNIAACGIKFGTGVSDSTYQSVTGISGQSGNLANFRGFDLVPSEHIGL